MLHIWIFFYCTAGAQRWMAVQSALIRRQDLESALGRRCVPAGLILKTSFVYALSFGSFFLDFVSCLTITCFCINFM